MTPELKEALDNLKKIRTENDSLAKKAMPKIESFCRTISLLTQISEGRWHKVYDERGNFTWKNSARNAMDALKRPPLVLTAIAFKKHE